MARPGLRFSLDEVATSNFGPRRGTLVLERPNGHCITLQTPAMLTGTSRGVVPHLSRDHVKGSAAISWIHVPFETYVEQTPPVPTLQNGPNPLHRFLGFDPEQHIVSLSLRDPDDVREMPPNGNKHISACSLRGVRKVAPTDWSNYVNACSPDLAIALSDIPHTTPPFSQKRLTKSLERSTAWLTSLLGSVASAKSSTTSQSPENSSPAVLVHLAGSASHPARAAFAASLTEPLNALETVAAGGLSNLDAGVAGYTVDLKPLRIAVTASHDESSVAEEISSLIRTSLSTLPPTKPRLVHGTIGPHDVLRLVRDVGIDVLEARWAIESASHGVAFDFVFPVPSDDGGNKEKKELGHNLYDVRYRLDLVRLADSFRGASESGEGRPSQRIVHGSDPTEAANAYSQGQTGEKEYNPPSTRAYLHHLLHTHEMSAHALLVAHNLAVADAFLAGIRSVLDTAGRDAFEAEVRRFEEAYGEVGAVLHEAKVMWAEVERARGKGRLAREKEKREDDQSDRVEMVGA
ncbi:hypothetical protein H0H92_010411 [Tricholoma furcatifolium]|nr:hypothetical protein H0H92_010411 [Tricholoma furcatifolium]